MLSITAEEEFKEETTDDKIENNSVNYDNESMSEESKNPDEADNDIDPKAVENSILEDMEVEEEEEWVDDANVSLTSDDEITKDNDIDKANDSDKDNITQNNDSDNDVITRNNDSDNDEITRNNDSDNDKDSDNETIMGSVFSSNLARLVQQKSKKGQ